MLKKLTTKRAGFTLVEIMIVVAIIALARGDCRSRIPSGAQALAGFENP